MKTLDFHLREKLTPKHPLCTARWCQELCVVGSGWAWKTPRRRLTQHPLLWGEPNGPQGAKQNRYAEETISQTSIKLALG